MAKAKGKGILKEQELSEELAEFMGKDYASRADCTKKIWAYIKKHDLNEGRDIYPDDELSPILGSKKITMFDIAKKLSNHIIKD